MANEEYTRAFTVALMADLAADPEAASAVARGKIRPDQLRRDVFTSVVRGVRGGRTPFRHVTALVRQQMAAEKKVARDAGMGAEANVWGAIGSAISGAANIASNVLTTKYEAKGQEAVAKLNAQSQALSLQAQQLAAQTADRMAAASASAAGTGTPGWVVPAAVGGGLLLLGGIVYAATRKGGRR